MTTVTRAAYRPPARPGVLSLLLTLVFMSLAAPTVGAQQGSAPPKNVKCPVCGMLVAKYPDWNSAISYRDGSSASFDGPKDLFTYYLNPSKYDPAKKRTDIAVVTVKDYYTLAPVDARKAYFVTGSNVLGPMGKELIPFEKKSDAEGFRMDHQGRRIVRFAEVTLEILKTLE